MRLRHIRYFLAVAEHRNFTRAAEALHVSQPTLSQQIRQLEDTLRVQLLDPSRPTIQLTAAARAVVVGQTAPDTRARAAATRRGPGREGASPHREFFPPRHYIDRYCRQHGVAPRIAMEVNSISAVIEIVQRSALATLLPAAIAREHSELCLVALEPALPQRTAALLLRKGAYRSAPARPFITLALEEGAAEPGGRRAKAAS